METMFLVGIFFVRVCFMAAFLALRLIAVLFFSPLLPKRNVRVAYARERPRRLTRREQQELRESSLLYQAGQLVRDLRAKPVTPGAGNPKQFAVVGEPSRNENDCALALKSLGYPIGQARKIAQSVALQLGPDADLNSMVKLGLQLAGTVR